MDPLTTAAASGIQARMDSLDMLANNIANASSGGFKADREFYNTYVAPELANTGDDTVGPAPVVQSGWTDFSQGTLVDTGKPTDLALSGKGFFAVNGPGGPLYTRNGSFQLTAAGSLVTSDGYPVRLANGQALQAQGDDPIEVNPDGEIRQGGNVLGQLELVDVPAGSLTRMGSMYFRTSGTPAATSASTAQVTQGKLENSNSGPTEAAARLVMVMRQFDMLQRAAKIGDQMNQQAVQQVASLGS